MHKSLNRDPEVPRHQSYALNQETGEAGQCAFGYPLNANEITIPLREPLLREAASFPQLGYKATQVS